jgi:hypothetical protein
MWLQPSPPVTDRWVLHIAATPHEVDDILAELYIHKRARPLATPTIRPTSPAAKPRASRRPG